MYRFSPDVVEPALECLVALEAMYGLNVWDSPIPTAAALSPTPTPDPLREENPLPRVFQDAVLPPFDPRLPAPPPPVSRALVRITLLNVAAKNGGELAHLPTALLQHMCELWNYAVVNPRSDGTGANHPCEGDNNISRIGGATDRGSQGVRPNTLRPADILRSPGGSISSGLRLELYLLSLLDWRVAVCRPGNHPMRKLIEAKRPLPLPHVVPAPVLVGRRGPPKVLPGLADIYP